MLFDILWLFFGLALLLVSAEILVRGAASLSLRFGLSPLLVGLTVVAFGTSAPELVVSVVAAYTGSGDISLGNVIGSNISNIGLILGVSAIIYPLKVQSKLVRIDAPILIYVSLLFLFFLRDFELARWEGFVLFTLLIVYVIYSFKISKTEDSPELNKEIEAEIKEPLKYPILDGVFIVSGIIGLVYGAEWLVDSAVTIAESFGINKAVTGLTIVAIGTSLPELATSVVAALKKESDIALGNVVGSNIFNMLSVMGLASMILPIEGADITIVDLSVMMAFTVLLLPMMWFRMNISRIEGLVLLAGYFAYMGFILL